MFRRIEDLLQSIKQRDPAARSLWEVGLLYPGVRALAFYRVGNALWRAGFTFLARFVSELGRWLSGIEIHPGATIGRRLFIDHGIGVVIGETAIVGDDVTLYHGVTLGGIAATHLQQGRRHPIIEDGVIVGAGAQVLGAITVGRGARVGANAVAVKDVAPGVTVVGIPAQVAAPRTGGTTAFAAYGTCVDLPDPTAKAIFALMTELHNLEERLAVVEAERNAAVPGTRKADLRPAFGPEG
jgi:serine O-acetyltransferase